MLIDKPLAISESEIAEMVLVGFRVSTNTHRQDTWDK